MSGRSDLGKISLSLNLAKCLRPSTLKNTWRQSNIENKRRHPFLSGMVMIVCVKHILFPQRTHLKETSHHQESRDPGTHCLPRRRFQNTWTGKTSGKLQPRVLHNLSRHLRAATESLTSQQGAMDTAPLGGYGVAVSLQGAAPPPDPRGCCASPPRPTCMLKADTIVTEVQ